MRENIHRTRSMPHILRRTQSQASEECYVSGSVRLPGDLAYAISQAPERTKTSYRSVDDSHPIHEDGFTLEAFRAGGPYLCTMPAHCGLSICPSRQEFFRGEQFRYTEDIKKILSRAGIPHFKTMGFLSRYSEFGSAQEPTMLTYLIDTREPFTNSWIDVCREIYEYFCQNGVPECAVEMVGKHAFVKDHFFPVRPEDPIYSRWYSILGDIFQRCILDHVNSIGCYRIGTTANWEDNPPTIFVTVNAHTDRDWRTFRENIVLILEDHDLPMVAVKIQADRILRGNALRKRDRMVPDAALERPAQVGHSVGMLNNSTGESGLFGGFLELRYPESEGWIPYGITSSRGLFSEGGGQVASPFNTSKSINFSKDTQLQAKGYIALRGWRCNGAHPKDTAAHCFLQVQQPSARDMEQHDKYCDEQMQEIVDVENHIHHHYQQKKSQVEKFRQADNHHIGSVFAASWERVKSSVAMPSAAMQGPGCEMEMDWALIEVPGHRMGDNNVSFTQHFLGLVPLNTSQLNHFFEPDIRPRALSRDTIPHPNLEIGKRPRSPRPQSIQMCIQHRPVPGHLSWPHDRAYLS